VTRLDRLDGPATAAIGDRLADVYRAAMGAAPFHETEVETGFFAEELAGELEEPGFRCWVAREDDRVVGFAYGYETPEVPSEGWFGLLRDAVGQGPDGVGRWLEGQFAVVWIAVRVGSPGGGGYRASGMRARRHPQAFPTGPRPSRRDHGLPDRTTAFPKRPRPSRQDHGHPDRTTAARDGNRLRVATQG
jgi:Acetyltransferase (GNAT) domain